MAYEKDLSETPLHIASILLVEDDDDDIEFILRSLASQKFVLNLEVVRDGEEAMLYLKHDGIYERKVHPDLVLLDLNLPKMNGKEVLKAIRLDEDLKNTPVVVLTTSCIYEDRDHFFRKFANCYLQKPFDMKKFSSILLHIEEFWFSVVKRPVV